MNGLISIAAIVALLLAAGLALGLLRPKSFSLRWLLIAAGLVVLNDALLTRCYGALPDLIPSADWNWQGKVLALAATLMVASLPAFGWRSAGLTLAQAKGSLLPAIPTAALYALFFLVLAFAFPSEPASAETIAFQLTMPGLEEEMFFRGVLLLALDKAFTARVRFLGIEWDWGALLSCALFGLAHAFGYGGEGFSFDAMTMALTAVPSLLAVWLRLRTGSVLIPILLHNFGNSIMLLL
jgi:membrane protease YdiL (CAAX protease family)